jgi:hypothetical protein
MSIYIYKTQVKIKAGIIYTTVVSAVKEFCAAGTTVVPAAMKYCTGNTTVVSARTDSCLPAVKKLGLADVHDGTDLKMWNEHAR